MKVWITELTHDNKSYEGPVIHAHTQEDAIKTAIDNISGNKTIIVIAHRLSTVKNADRILFLEKGKIENEGTHKELIRNNKKYKKLADLQFL